MKILNLYANIGGNRKSWGDEHDITSVEITGKFVIPYEGSGDWLRELYSFIDGKAV